MMLALKSGPQIAAKVGNPAGLLCQRIWYSVGKSGVLGITEYRQGRPLKFIGNYSTRKNCSKRKLFQSYCTSFYGSELWSLSSKGLEECCIAWRKGARRIFNMSYQTHSFLVGPLSGQRSIDEMLYRKILKFVYSVMNSNNSIVAHIGQLRQSAKSPIGGNVACFRYKFGIDVDDNVLKNLRLIS